MEIREIEPRFEKIEDRLGLLEGVETAIDADPDAEIDEQTATDAEIDKETVEDTSEDAAPFSELRSAISEDASLFTAGDVMQAYLKHPELIKARETVWDMDSGKERKMQPVRLTDGNFKVLTKPMIEQVVAETKIDEVEWAADVSDCEDICLRFNSRCLELGFNSCGRVMSWAGQHCFIVFLYRDETNKLGFLFFEPQTDQFITEFVDNYSLENCLIVIN